MRIGSALAFRISPSMCLRVALVHGLPTGMIRLQKQSVTVSPASILHDFASCVLIIQLGPVKQCMKKTGTHTAVDIAQYVTGMKSSS